MRAFEIYEDSDDSLGHELVLGVSKIVEEIKAKCAPWLAQTDGGSLPVWRGMNSLPGDVIYSGYDFNGDDLMAGVKEVRKDRKPKDSSDFYHNMLIQHIRDKGYEASRDNSVFVSGNMNQAAGYGTVYAILPIGDFKFTWNTQYGDSYTAYTDIKRELTKDETPPDVMSHYINKWLEKIKRGEVEQQVTILLKKQYETTLRIKFHKQPMPKLQRIHNNYTGNWDTPQDATQNNYSKSKMVNDIVKYKMDHLDEEPDFLNQLDDAIAAAAKKVKVTGEMKRLAFRAAADEAPYSSHETNIDPEKVRDQISKYFSDEDLPEAIKQGHEIMIACDHYIMVSERLWKRYVAPTLQGGDAQSVVKTWMDKENGV